MNSSKEFIINLGNCQGLVYKFEKGELLARYRNSNLWFKSQKIIKDYITKNSNLIIYLRNNNERI